jgi:hypothetical protein
LSWDVWNEQHRVSQALLDVFQLTVDAIDLGIHTTHFLNALVPLVLVLEPAYRLRLLVSVSAKVLEPTECGTPRLIELDYSFHYRNVFATALQ